MLVWANTLCTPCVGLPGNYGIMHDWSGRLNQHLPTLVSQCNPVDSLVWLILEVTVPSRPELRERPFVHLLKLRLGRADLDACFDAIGREWPCSIDVPLFVSFPLGFGITANEVVKRLALWLCAVGGKRKVVILEI